MKTLIDLYSAFVSRGERIAFVDRTEVRRFVYTYEVFATRIAQMTLWLDQRGIAAGDRVAIWAPNSFWWAVSYFGCLMKGVVVVPLDFNSGLDRAQKILDLAGGVKLVLQSQYKAEKFELANAYLIEHLQYCLPEYSGVGTS